VGATKYILISYVSYKLFNDYLSTAYFFSIEWNGKMSNKALGGSSYGASLSSMFEYTKTDSRKLNKPRLQSSEMSHQVFQ
jgi:hypothetical protein